MEKRFGQIASSYLIIQKSGQVLLSRRLSTGYHDGEYSLVAGHVEKNETIRECLVREAAEEAGIQINLKDIKLQHVLHRPSDATDDRRVDFFWSIDKWKGDPRIMEPDKCDEISWHAWDKIPKNTILYIRQALKCIRNKEIYSEFGWKEIDKGEK